MPYYMAFGKGKAIRMEWLPRIKGARRWCDYKGMMELFPTSCAKVK